MKNVKQICIITSFGLPTPELIILSCFIQFSTITSKIFFIESVVIWVSREFINDETEIFNDSFIIVVVNLWPIGKDENTWSIYYIK